MYTTHLNSLILDHCVISFDHPIGQDLQIGHMLIILLEVPPHIPFRRNIFGVDLLESKIKWQVEDRHFPFDDRVKCKYIDMSYYNNQLRTNNWCESYSIVDPLTGKII